MQKIIIASGPVIVEKNKVLLDISGGDEFWKFCGGEIREHELLWETAKRRSQEELGIEIEILDKHPFLIYTEKQTEGGPRDVILAHFLARKIGEIKPGNDIRQWRWIPFEELTKEDLAPNILPTLKHFGFIQ